MAFAERSRSALRYAAAVAAAAPGFAVAGGFAAAFLAARLLRGFVAFAPVPATAVAVPPVVLLAVCAGDGAAAGFGLLIVVAMVLSVCAVRSSAAR